MTVLEGTDFCLLALRAVILVEQLLLDSALTFDTADFVILRVWGRDFTSLDASGFVFNGCFLGTLTVAGFMVVLEAEVLDLVGGAFDLVGCVLGREGFTTVADLAGLDFTVAGFTAAGFCCLSERELLPTHGLGLMKILCEALDALAAVGKNGFLA